MPITIDFAHKLVLLTGGGRGIGLGIAKALAESGADLAITYTSKDCSDVAASLAKEHGVRVEAFKCDVSKSDDVDRCVDEVTKAFGRQVDIGLANAGIAYWGDSHKMPDQELQNIFNVNAFGPYYLSRSLVRSWLAVPTALSSSSAEDPSIRSYPTNHLAGKQLFVISSISGLVAMAPQHQSAYNASKAAATMFVKSLAAEWAHLGLSVNSISPGYVETDMIASSENPEVKEWIKDWQRRTPAPR